MASEIRVNKINSRTGVGTITLSPTGVDFTGIATVATLKATTGIVTTFSATGNATVGGTLNVTGETTFATHVNLGDSDKAKFGTSGDLEIYHNGTDSYVDTDVGDLRLRTTGSADDIYLTSVDDVFIQVQSTETAAKFIGNGAVELNYNDSKKFETKSDGVDITGELQCDTLDVDGDIDLDGKITFDSGGNVLDFIDNVAARFGTGNDLRVYHDGSNSRIKNTTGSLWLQSDTGIRFTDADVNESMAAFYDNGAVELYYDGSKKFETLTNGVRAQGGILFGSDTADANALDDYEEGTWTPTANNYDGTLSVNTASYTKIGTLCFVHAYVSFSNTVDTSDIVIAGLPFTAFSGNNNYYVISAHTNGGTEELNLRAQGTTTEMRAVHLSSGDGDSKPSYSSLASKFIIFSGCFKTT